MRAPFAWDGHGIVVTLGADEARLLAGLPGLLATFSSDQAASRRLEPPAYREDEAAQAEYRRLMAGELVRARADDRDVWSETVRAGSFSLTVDQAETWLRVIGDARLGLAARRGVIGGDDEWERLVGIDPDLTLVAWLGSLQASLVEAIGAALPNG